MRADERVAELVRCARDPLYFARRWVRIQHPVRGDVAFEPYVYQCRFIEAMSRHRWVIAMMGRQMGKTTCVATYMVWRLLFLPEQTILVAANKQAGALEVMHRVRFIFERLPRWMVPRATAWNRLSLEFDNGSRIKARATTEDTGRGPSVSLLYLDEFAFVRQTIAREFWASVQPTLATGGSCVITSTPNTADDLFAEIWRGATDTVDDDGREIADGVGRNGFYALRFPWHEHPERDESWAAEQRRKLGEDRFRREHGCEFGGAENSLIDGTTITRLRRHVSIANGPDTVRWFGEPVAGAAHVVALDPSAGVGGDAAAITAWCGADGRLVQIAEWEESTADVARQVAVLRAVIEAIEAKGGDVWWVAESNGIGLAALQMALEDPNGFPGEAVHDRPKLGARSQVRRMGVAMTAGRKLALCARLKALIEGGRMEPRGPRLISELANYVRSGSGFAARSGMRDDLVASTLLAIRAFETIAQMDDRTYGALAATGQQRETEEEFYLPVVSTGRIWF